TGLDSAQVSSTFPSSSLSRNVFAALATADRSSGVPCSTVSGTSSTRELHPAEISSKISTADRILIGHLTPKLSRDAAGREAHGKLFLPCGLRPDAVSA